MSEGASERAFCPLNTQGGEAPGEKRVKACARVFDKVNGARNAYEQNLQEFPDSKDQAANFMLAELCPALFRRRALAEEARTDVDVTGLMSLLEVGRTMQMHEDID